MGINIERYGNVFAHLNVELLDTILTEDTEQTFLRILAWNFDNIVLRHPRITRALRYTTACRKNGNYFSC